MIDPLLSLAYSMHTNPGVYALLLGSGVSRSASIPTGWEIALDLIRKLARLLGEDCEPDPATWYLARFGENPDYSKLLEQVAKSPAERANMLRSYFEPNEEEAAQGLKTPTEAHRAIAELVAGKYIRVIVTTNFDRLLEKAFDAVGVVPSVLSTPDAIEGSLPLRHSACTVIKIHGDYLDTRIRNTPKELERYDRRVSRLLDQILDEFGLVVCGWSGEWDTALRAALERCKSRRFTTYWASKGEPSEAAQELIALRKAQVITIDNADAFFTGLEEKVQALEDIDRPHPLSAKVAVATMKKYLVDDRYRIDRHDLVMRETEELFSRLSTQYFPVNVGFSPDRMSLRLRQYKALVEIVQALVVTGCYWGGQTHADLWVKCLERVASSAVQSGRTIWLELQKYPALLLLYSGGIAALAAGNYDTFASLLTKPTVREADEVLPLFFSGNVYRVGDAETWRQLPGLERHRTPVNDHLFSVLREPLKEYLPHEREYERCFNGFEYLSALVYADYYEKSPNKMRDIRGPIGRFGWEDRFSWKKTIMGELEAEATSAGESWPPLKAGLFDGSIERFTAVKKAFDKWMIEVTPGWGW